jgi:hypothetical protein
VDWLDGARRDVTVSAQVIAGPHGQ